MITLESDLEEDPELPPGTEQSTNKDKSDKGSLSNNERISEVFERAKDRE